MEGTSTTAGAGIGSVVRVVADDRESRSSVCERLAARLDVRLEVGRLEVGDYEVEGEWRFERKTVADFGASLLDGRLFRQAHRLAQCPGGRALILEGSEADLSGISRESWQGALVSLGLAFQLPVLRSEDASETVRLLVYAGRQVMRQREVVFVAVPRRARTLLRQRLRVLSAIPGVGARRARMLLEHFGSIEAVVLAGVEELAEVRGVGPQTAARIRKVVAAGSQAPCGGGID
ncbi:MAG: nuclease [Verrucomicrobia bacterium]|nr:nuclease [Verrucomicrobiota bacterium]